MTDDPSRPLRSWLFTPGTRPERFAKAAEIGADVLIIDLEDAVAPEGKAGARATALECLSGNGHMPRVGGVGSMLHFSEVEAVVEHDAPLLELPVRDGGPDDAAIGKIVAGTVPDGACLPMGVGALPNLICAELKDRKDLGVHTEALNPGLVDLIKAGVVTNRRKALNTGTSIFTFAMGQKAMYELIDGNPAIESAPVDYVSNPAVIARNDNVFSINATIQIDLTGACNSEHMLGHRYSASGGQLGFVRGAYASNGGKSIIATASTAAKSKVSKIVARLDGPVTAPRIDTHWIVTEFGSANLKNLSSTERAKALIGLAHPEFHDKLMASAKELHPV